MKKELPRVPFTIDIRRNGRLAEQAAAGFRQAIRSGYYKPGDVLPTFRDLARVLGCSIRISIEAFRLLTEEGLVYSRHGVGTIVLAPGEAIKKGHVVFVTVWDSSPYTNAVANAIRDTVSQAGYLFTRVSVPERPDGTFDFSALDLALDKTISMALLMYDYGAVAKHLAEKGVPYVAYVTSRHAYPKCAGQVVQNRNAAIPDFVAHCVRAGVRNVLQVSPEEGFFNAADALASAGIRADFRLVPYPEPERPELIIETVKRTAFEYFDRLLDGKGPLPELLAVADDYYAEGALVALAKHGLRVPEDVKVVVWANRGFGPVWSIPLTRVELDPHDDGLTLGRALLAQLEGKGFPKNAAVEPKYVVGASFPE